MLNKLEIAEEGLSGSSGLFGLSGSTKYRDKPENPNKRLEHPAML
jgi:hypothetical protein